MKSKRILLLILPAMMFALAAAAVPADSLESGFHNPPDSAKPLTWWHWMDGNVTRQGIVADLKAMKEIGEGGATIVNVGQIGIPPGSAPFMSRKWQGDFKFAVQEANRLGLKLGVENCDGWSSSGGPWVKPQYAMQMVVFSATHVHGPTNFDQLLKQPETRLGYYRDIEVLAFPTPPVKKRIPDIKFKADYSWRYGQQPDIVPFPTNAIIARSSIVNLSKRMATDGRLVWSVPSGNWTILRIGYTPIGTKNHPASKSGWGLECDKLSRKALDKYWAGFMQKILREVRPYVGKTLTSSLIDSYEVGAQNWTPRFRQDFEELRGYDPLPWLPVLSGRVIESDAASERFLWDMRLTIADLFAHNYYDYFGVLCHKNRLMSHIEPYDGPYECLQVGKGADVPMGEFWYGKDNKYYSSKLAASVGHVYGRRIIGAESFTASSDHAGWQAYPFSLKALGDLEYANGINRFTFHEYAMQPWRHEYPGMTMGQYGTELCRTITWWKQGRAWIHYLTRCQYLLQQGRFVADVCYYAGEVAPNEAPYHPELKTEGYDYDACDTGVLLHGMTVHGGQLALPDGMRYHVLVLPDTRFMTPTVLAKLRELISAGATVIGPKPTLSPSLKDYPECDTTVRRLAEEIWGNCDGQTVKEHAFGRGRVIWGKSVPEVLAEMGVKPDCTFATRKGKPDVAWIHRVVGATDIYFVSNQRREFDSVECTFRVSGKIPELWHPDTGAIESAPVWSEHDGCTTVPLDFQPAGSVFVIFRPAASGTDHVVAANGSFAAQPADPPTLKILRADYTAVDGAGGMDVTAKLSQLARDGQLMVKASNSTFGRDPALNHKKELRVDYAFNGKTGDLTVPEGGTLRLPPNPPMGEAPPWSVGLAANGSPVVKFWEDGSVKLQTADGKVLSVDATNVPSPQTVTGAWELNFPAHWGAPPSVTLDKLISWTDDTNAGVRYFSGTATYEKEIEIPADRLTAGRDLWLDLGVVKVLAEVSLNGHDFGVLWKPPFRVNITRAAKPGANLLVVKVTNLWPNRLIGDEHLPPDCEWDGDRLKQWPQWLLAGKPSPTGRFTFTTWRHYTKDSPLLESGLLGPVTLQTAEIIPAR